MGDATASTTLLVFFNQMQGFQGVISAAQSSQGTLWIKNCLVWGIH